MSQNILQSAIRCGVFEQNISLKPFIERVEAQSCVVPTSVVKAGDRIFMICEKGVDSHMIVFSTHENSLDVFNGSESISEHEAGLDYFLLQCPLNHANAAALRDVLPWTAPSVLDCRESFGFGDRIGAPAQATPWHIESSLAYNVTPVLAQQSVRENTKTGRNFESVMDDATWSVLRSKFKNPWGSDADHLKLIEDIEEAAEAGFTMFTLDPSDLIDNDVDTDSDDVIKAKFDKLFEKEAEAKDYLARCLKFDGADEGLVIKAGVKYLAAVRHAVTAYRKLVEIKGEGNFNFEMSIDETLTATSPLDHRIIATELQRAEVSLFSVAPRFEGAFEKGIDYKGSVDGFKRTLEEHVKVARECGGYRLSLHSGSDKFSVYPAFGEITDGFFHVKTAGTSYLEAVKVMAMDKPDLFSEIFKLSWDTFEDNVKYYEISADIANVPDPERIASMDAVALITDNPDLRQVLHIAFGIVLDKHGTDLKSALKTHYDSYRSCLTEHLGKHLALLTGK